MHTVNGVGYLLAPYLRAVELIGLEGIVYIARLCRVFKHPIRRGKAGIGYVFVRRRLYVRQALANQLYFVKPGIRRKGQAVYFAPYALLLLIYPGEHIYGRFRIVAPLKIYRAGVYGCVKPAGNIAEPA